jgi:hypothetical protein
MCRSLDKEPALTENSKLALVLGKNNKLSFLGVLIRDYDPSLEYKLINELIDCGALPKLDGMTNNQSFDFYLKVQTIHSRIDPTEWDIYLARLAAEYGEMN